MGDIEALRQADLAGTDIAAALDLSNAVGWNQTEADWAVFIGHGRAFGLFEPRGRLIATAAVLPYDRGFGWISMVIVAPDRRGRGLASRLMQTAIETLQARGRVALLDATPAGAEVYGRMGFVALGGMGRWEGEGGAVVPASGSVTSLVPGDLDRLMAADAAAFGADRRFLLGDILARDGGSALAADGAYLVVRRGYRATQLGPMVAASPAAAGHLLAAAGFRRQRPFLRMALGRATLPGEPAKLVLAAGPEFG